MLWFLSFATFWLAFWAVFVLTAAFLVYVVPVLLLIALVLCWLGRDLSPEEQARARSARERI